MTWSISRIPGPPCGPFVADHDDVAGLDLACLDRGEARPPRSRTPAPARGGCARSWPDELDHAAVRREVAAQDPRASPSDLIGVSIGRDHVLTFGLDGRVADLAERLAVDRRRAGVHELAFFSSRATSATPPAR